MPLYRLRFVPPARRVVLRAEDRRVVLRPDFDDARRAVERFGARFAPERLLLARFEPARFEDARFEDADRVDLRVLRDDAARLDPDRFDAGRELRFVVRFVRELDALRVLLRRAGAAFAIVRLRPLFFAAVLRVVPDGFDFEPLREREEEPDFERRDVLRPPLSLFTVANARRLASRAGTPRPS